MTILIFFLLLSVLVLVHELGHFIAAKKLGVAVEEFGLGLPPRIRRLFVWKGTEFTLNWLPIGGFVRMRGEDQSNQKGLTSSQQRLDLKGYFFAQKPWKRAIILVAGVTMNMLLGIFAFSAVYTYMGIPEQGDEVRIEGTLPGTPAERAGLQAGDIVRELQAQESRVQVTDTTEFVQLINAHRGEEIRVVVDRSGERREIPVTPRMEAETPEGEGALGVAVSAVKLVRYPWWQMPFRAAWVGIREAFAWGINIVAGLANMLGLLFLRGQIPTDVAGPVGIAKLTGDVAARGWVPLMQLLGVLSVNLAIVNLLPIPALDGGRLLFLGIEKLRGRPVDPTKERWAHLVGYALLIALIILITINDVLRLTGPIQPF